MLQLFISTKEAVSEKVNAFVLWLWGVGVSRRVHSELTATQIAMLDAVQKTNSDGCLGDPGNLHHLMVDVRTAFQSYTQSNHPRGSLSCLIKLRLRIEGIRSHFKHEVLLVGEGKVNVALKIVLFFENERPLHTIVASRRKRDDVGEGLNAVEFTNPDRSWLVAVDDSSARPVMDATGQLPPSFPQLFYHCKSAGVEQHQPRLLTLASVHPTLLIKQFNLFVAIPQSKRFVEGIRWDGSIDVVSNRFKSGFTTLIVEVPLHLIAKNLKSS
mmetsp:Transcript_38199/g.75183  ORF Transcript_38199/g.75183 Transcript_38199/m.75183 type:complete len:270 (-) Transcript_38199:235-1044(-)